MGKLSEFQIPDMHRHIPTVTEETRRESYQKSLPDIGAKQQVVYDVLKMNNNITARRLATIMYHMSLIPSKDDLNAVRPRLTELCQAGLVEVIRKEYDYTSKRMVSVFKIREEKADD
jgi:hypothetical protein